MHKIPVAVTIHKKHMATTHTYINTYSVLKMVKAIHIIITVDENIILLYIIIMGLY